ncbi:hypothetical protein RSOLAG1IB_02725 [Rhizoctonia solani AG-1 IB]|uniref:Uncharacterized protein n=1 Tax=Thanatephorus cucumeris (strain AG1-IB / isolate 7/3/14) TaxID=1108050 RepID=A0A0B7FJY7_THACB|nr:hypothetical protein RSOLAG1IB_02725 [Rhizoctonia solani AG-1 IB]
MEDLQLNHTQLLFVPGPSESDIPHIVQVTLNSETSPVSFEALARYHSVKPHLTKLILLVLAHHRSKPLSTPATFLGEGFALVATHRPWTYGKGWSFEWGDESVLPAEDKWTFEFQVR